MVKYKEMRLHITVLLLLFAFPCISFALGLGKIETRSGLNEPFEARIELIAATADDLVGLNVQLADREAFEKAGIERPYILHQLMFGLRETEKGPDYIRVYSQDPISEPFLNFLVEVSWPQGRLIREYTVLLDPPVYAPTTGMVGKRVESPVETVSPITTKEEEDHAVVYYPGYEQKAPEGVSEIPAARTIDYTGGDYGPTVTGDTLWSIAKAMRPDSSVSIQQMMLALLRANPDVFINGNINGLKRGEVLRMPDISDAMSVSKDEAFAEAKTQNELWESARMALAETPVQRPEGIESSVGEAMPAVEEEPSAEIMAEEAEPELRLVAPTEEGIGTDQSVLEGDAAGEEAAKELALVKESLETLKLENAELEEKLVESEEIIGDLKRLIALKEDEFNVLEEQIKQAAAEEAAMESAEQEAVVQEEAVMEETGEQVQEEQPAPETMEMAEEKAAPEAVQAEVTADISQPVAEGGVMTTVMGYLNSFINMVKGNLVLLAGGLAAVLVLIGIGLFAIKRRSAGESYESQEVELPVYDQLGDDDSEDITDLPGFEGEAVMAAEEAGEQEAAATQIVPPPPAPAEVPATEVEEPEEDPLADVNVFLAYEQFDQAEEFVKNALAEDPENPEFHSKLLEVFYAAGNKKSYEEAARALQPIVNGQGEYWDMALAMWQELSPNRALFEEPAEGEEAETTAAEPVGGIVNITEDTGEEPREAVLDVTAAIDLDEIEEEEFAEEEKGSAPDFDLSMDIDSEAATLSEEPDEGEEGALEFTEAEDNEVLDVSAALDFDLEEEEAVDEPETAETEADENILDISSEEGLSMEAPEEAEVQDADVLDITGSSEADLESSGEVSEVEEEKDTDVLDITGGYDISLEEEPEEVAGEVEESEILDITGGFEGEMDISLEEEPSEDQVEQEEMEEVLDLSLEEESPVSEKSQPSEEDSGLEFSMEEAPEEEAAGEEGEPAEEESYTDVKKAEDLLDVTSAMEYREEEAGTSNLLDVTTAYEEGQEEKATEAGSEKETAELPETEEVPPEEGEIALDISLDQEEETGDEASESVASLDLDITGTADKADEEIEASIDLGADVEEGKQEIDEAGALDFDISLDKEEEAATDESATEEKESSFELDMSSNLIDLSVDEEEPKEAENEDYEMDQTVHIPGIGLSMDEDEDEEQPTVFVPRSDGTEQKSEEDEIGTQLDLARAYIELGDNDNARTILDEIISKGTDQQRQDAQELLGKIT